MIEKHPLSDRLLKGEWWRYPSPKWEERPPKPEVVEAVRRMERKLIEEYFEKRRRREAGGEA
jgi:hypothetical protein